MIRSAIRAMAWSVWQRRMIAAYDNEDNKLIRRLVESAVEAMEREEQADGE